MASSTEFVVGVRHRGFLWLLAFLVFAYAAWFAVVLLGVDQGWTDDPGRWAILPTAAWAFIGLAFFVLAAVYFVALLVRREHPAYIYRLDETQFPAPEPAAPSFFQTPPAEGTEPKA